MEVKKIAGIFSLLVLLIACAQQKPLTGGERDFTPPKVMAAYPPALTTSFKGNTFSITFDEYVQLNSIQQELLISPPLAKFPDVKVKNRTVIVTFQEPLAENTTYTFNFSDGVTDLNEGNKAEDLIYVISTGDYLDSLAFHGKANYRQKNEAAGGVRILVYPDTVQMGSEKLPTPAYFARTKKDGSYVIPFMREGKYSIFALEDLSANFQVEQDERVAIAQTNVQPQVVDSNAAPLNFELYEQMFYTPDMANYNVDSIGRFVLPWSPFFSERIEYQLQWLSDAEGRLYFNDASDSLYYEVKGAVTNRYEKLKIRLGENTDTVEVPCFKDDFKEKIKLSHSLSARFNAGDSVFFYLPSFATEDSSLTVLFKEDSLEKIRVQPKRIRENKFFILPALEKGKKYQMIIPRGLFSDIAGVANDSLKVSFSTFLPEDLGQIIIEPDDAMREMQGWIELINRTNVRVKKQRIQPGDTKLIWKDIVPGEYSIRYFVDTNDNTLWDPVHYPSQLDAEFIYVFPEKINVRANWELKQKLELPK